VEKGSAPCDASGAEILYSGTDGHREAKRELHRRLGRYCSYCERWGDLHVEHVIPKKKHDEVRHLWVNYLLGCKNCNGVKLEKDPLTTEWDCLFPDEVNTMWAFVYGPGAHIAVNPRLDSDAQGRAQKTITMVGLDRNPPPDPEDRDLRWEDRDQVWRQAEDALADLQADDSLVLRKHILNEAVGAGFFSVWWTVFGLDGDMNRRAKMRLELIQLFKARRSCFQDDGSVCETLAVA
jgi:hypothetical protein